MAIFLEGMRCGLCGKAMYESDKLISFPAFVANPQDPIYPFSDATVHSTCLETYPSGQEALFQFDFIKSNFPIECMICGLSVNKPAEDTRAGFLYLEQEVIRLPHLVYSPLSSAYNYNFAVFHRKCLPGWPERETLRSAIEGLSGLAYCSVELVNYWLRDLGFLETAV